MFIQLILNGKNRLSSKWNDIRCNTKASEPQRMLIHSNINNEMYANLENSRAEIEAYAYRERIKQIQVLAGRESMPEGLPEAAQKEMGRYLDSKMLINIITERGSKFQGLMPATIEGIYAKNATVTINSYKPKFADIFISILEKIAKR